MPRLCVAIFLLMLFTAGFANAQTLRLLYADDFSDGDRTPWPAGYMDAGRLRLSSTANWESSTLARDKWDWIQEVSFEFEYDRWDPLGAVSVTIGDWIGFHEQWHSWSLVDGTPEFDQQPGDYYIPGTGEVRITVDADSARCWFNGELFAVTPNAAFVSNGVRLSGRGAVWFDNVEIWGYGEPITEMDFLMSATSPNAWWGNGQEIEADLSLDYDGSTLHDVEVHPSYRSFVDRQDMAPETVYLGSVQREHFFTPTPSEYLRIYGAWVEFRALDGRYLGVLNQPEAFIVNPVQHLVRDVQLATTECERSGVCRNQWWTSFNMFSSQDMLDEMLALRCRAGILYADDPDLYNLAVMVRFAAAMNAGLVTMRAAAESMVAGDYSHGYPVTLASRDLTGARIDELLDCSGRNQIENYFGRWSAGAWAAREVPESEFVHALTDSLTGELRWFPDNWSNILFVGGPARIEVRAGGARSTADEIGLDATVFGGLGIDRGAWAAVGAEVWPLGLARDNPDSEVELFVTADNHDGGTVTVVLFDRSVPCGLTRLAYDSVQLQGTSVLRMSRSDTRCNPLLELDADGDGIFESIVPAESRTVGMQDAPAAGLRTRLGAARPNPFNPSTRIEYALATSVALDLSVFDAAGRKVRTLVSQVVPAGRHVAHWDGRDGSGRRVASGVYFFRMTTPGFTETRKAVLLK